MITISVFWLAAIISAALAVGFAAGAIWHAAAGLKAKLRDVGFEEE